MSDPGKAVFLSYASQDAEAAKRICDALRAAGVEVWFDQSELVGGDAWDQKIRKQIRECALLLPVISKTTQGRREAYFRLEWKLADERTHLMAKGTPFLLPITIDETGDRDALVPDSFVAIQWTKAPGGEVPPAFVARVKRLLDGETARGVGALRPDAPETSGHKAPPATESPRWLKPVLASGALVIAVLAYTVITRPPTGATASPPASSPAPASAPAAVSPPHISVARELVEKAYPLIHALDARREDFALAEDYCQRALKLDPDDGEIWAAYSQVHSAFGYRGWDTSPERREQTRVTAERAIRLAPRSVRARLAQAGAWASFGVNRDEREKLLRDIVSEQPDHQEALRFLAVTVLAKPGGLEEAVALNERSAALPGGDPLALFNNARYLWQNGRLDDGYATLQRSLAQQKFTSALVLKVAMEINWRGDLAAAEETLQQIPGDALLEDRANYVAGQLRYYQRNGAAALATWQTFPRDFYSDFVFDGPKGLLLGLADELDHRDAAARTEWRAALREVEKKIAAAPNKAGPYYSQAYLLACLGEKAAAGEALRTHEQLAGIKHAAGEPMANSLAKVYARLGRFDEIFARPPAVAAILRLSPDFDGLRADPRFASWITAGSPVQAAPPAVAGASSSAKPTEDASGRAAPDAKSVAVLAFANLSDDKANEYFSDGISEELLTVLQKIPGLRVAARTSAFSFKGSNATAPEIGAKLGVATLVEGSVRKAGTSVRITARLSRAATGEQLWSESYTRDLKDVFAVQSELAQTIVGQLHGQLGGPGSAAEIQAQVQAAEKGGTRNAEAHQLYLQGKFFVNRSNADDAMKAIDLLQRAVDLDPKFALAWAALSKAGWIRGAYGNNRRDFDEGYALARRAADQAIALEPGLAAGYLARLDIQSSTDFDWQGSKESLRRAQELAPNDPAVIFRAAQLAFSFGREAEGLELIRQAVALDPVNPEIYVNQGFMLQAARRFAEAETAFRRLLDIRSDSPWGYAGLAMVMVARGDFDQAAVTVLQQAPNWSQLYVQSLALWGQKKQSESDAALARLIQEYGDVAAYQIGCAYAFRGDADRAFEWLERAYRQKDPGLSYAKPDFLLIPLHADPRWEVLMRKLGLADDQLR